MSKEITVNCNNCGYNGPHEIGNDGFEQEYPYCPGCCSDLILDSKSNTYKYNASRHKNNRNKKKLRISM